MSNEEGETREITAVDHINKDSMVNLMKNFDSIPLAKAAKANDAKDHEEEREEDDDAEWDEPSSCEDVYNKYVQKTDADGKPVFWKA